MTDPVLLETSVPHVFATGEGKLIHESLGPLPITVSSLPPLAGGRRLIVTNRPAPAHLKISPGRGIIQSPSPRNNVTPRNGKSIYSRIKDEFKIVQEYLGYVSTVTSVIDFVNGLNGLLDESDPLADIQTKLETILTAVGASDYLQKARELADMRGKAGTIHKNLKIAVNPAASQKERDIADAQIAQLSADVLSHIEALLADGLPYFRRVYTEASIAGDNGSWLHVLPDRPQSPDGTCFEYRLATPTLIFLISVELAVFKYQNPNFIESGSQKPFIEEWWRKTLDLSGIILDYTIRGLHPLSVEVQCVKTREQLGLPIDAQYSDWQLHVPAKPPFAVAPAGAVDITTGLNNINWDYTQFNEFYLKDQLVPGQNAGPNPPCLGKFYNPPPWLKNPRSVEDMIASYVSTANNYVANARGQLHAQMGVSDTGVFAWSLWPFMTKDPLPF
jgi:hypothetical protein